MKKLRTYLKIAHKPKIRADFILSRIWLSVGSRSFDQGLLGALKFEIQTELDFGLVIKVVELV